MYCYYYGNLKTRKCITLCSYKIAAQFGTAAMRYTSRSLLEGQQPQLCRECLGQTRDVNELKSGKINKSQSLVKGTIQDSQAVVRGTVKACHLNQIANHLHNGNLVKCNNPKQSHLGTKCYFSVACGT